MEIKFWKNRRKSKRPWLSNDGSKKNDFQISRINKKWSQKTWDSFLNEELGVFDKQDEEGRMAGIQDKHLYFYKDFKKKIKNSEPTQGPLRIAYLQAMLDGAFERMSKKDTLLLREIFLEGRNPEDTTYKSKVSLFAVYKARDRALQKLKNILVDKFFPRRLESNKNFQTRIARLKKLKDRNPKHWNELEFLEECLPYLTTFEVAFVQKYFFSDKLTAVIIREMGITLKKAVQLKESVRKKLSEVYQEGYTNNKRRNGKRKTTENQTTLSLVV